MTFTKYKYRHISLFLILLSAFFLPATALGQKRVKLYEDYIDKYSDLAVDHMNKYRIPSSITLAQGLLESGAGMSDLSRRSNNHFGIKCHRGWEGGKVYAADDTPNDCFRKYNRVEDSYVDHSEFLAYGSRYKVLFDLSPTDYKGWARGLQQTGYATDRAYANKLIKLIEDYELYRFDDKKYRRRSAQANAVQQEPPVSASAWKHQPFISYGLVYVIAVEGDSFASIANEFGFKEKDLLNYNEVPSDFPLTAGDIVYFQKKKSKADKPNYEHVVKIGESVHSISQLYGIRVKSLYRLNKKDYEYVPVEGDVLKLR